MLNTNSVSTLYFGMAIEEKDRGQLDYKIE